MPRLSPRRSCRRATACCWSAVPKHREAKEAMGHEEPGRLSRDRANYDAIRVYVSKAAFIGKPLREIPLPDFPVMISHVRRGDAEMVASSDLTIEFGDLLVVAVPTGKQAEVRRYFGDSIKGNAELSFVSDRRRDRARPPARHDPGATSGGRHFSLGVAGGPLVMALVLGWLGRTGPIGWSMPWSRTWSCAIWACRSSSDRSQSARAAPFVETVASNGSRSFSAAPPCCSLWS